MKFCCISVVCVFVTAPSNRCAVMFSYVLKSTQTQKLLNVLFMNSYPTILVSEMNLPLFLCLKCVLYFFFRENCCSADQDHEVNK